MEHSVNRKIAAAPEDPAATFRPVDLARAAGVSPSLVRLYEAEGFLPPAIRMPSGHRRYDQHHLRSLLVARALRTGYGWTLARTAMRAIHSGDLDAALAVTNRRHAELHAEAEQLGRALDAIQNTRPEQRPAGSGGQRRLSIGAAARQLQVTPATLRHWESTGVIRPGRVQNGRRLYTETDIRQLELVQVLRNAGYSFESIARLMTSLRSNDRIQTRDALATRQAQLRQQTRAAAAATRDLVGLINDLEPG